VLQKVYFSSFLIEGVLYQSFGREQDFREALQFAQDFDYILWYSEEKKMFVVTQDGNENVRAWFKSKQV
jgi:hypothetical protein